MHAYIHTYSGTPKVLVTYIALLSWATLIMNSYKCSSCYSGMQQEGGQYGVTDSVTRVIGWLYACHLRQFVAARMYFVCVWCTCTEPPATVIIGTELL